MNHKNIKINGKKRKIACPVSEIDLWHQVEEIFDIEHYKAGKKKGVIIDAGANIGLASLYFADTAKKIYALEPNPKIFEALKINTKGYKNIEVFNVGLGNEEGEGFLYSDKEEELPQTVFKGETIALIQRAKFTTLEKFMEKNKIDHVDTLKLDIEGAEYAILPDESFGRIADRIDLIVGEGHYVPYHGAFAEAIPHILKEYGFKTEFIKFPKGNYLRTLMFNNLRTGQVKTYPVSFNTIFVAKR